MASDVTVMPDQVSIGVRVSVIPRDVIDVAVAARGNLSIAYTREVELAGAQMSTGSVGDSYDNALAETTIGTYKTELIARQGPWHNLTQLELAILEYVDWYNHRRLHEACGYRPPVEHEALYYRTRTDATVARTQ